MARAGSVAGITPHEGGMREVFSQQVAKGLLVSVLTVGQHHMVEPEEWPDEMPAAVLGAVRSAKRIKSDPDHGESARYRILHVTGVGE